MAVGNNWGNDVTNSLSGHSYTWRNLSVYNYSQTDTTFTVSLKVKFYGAYGSSSNLHFSAGNFSAKINIAGVQVASFVSSSDKNLYGGEANAWQVIDYSHTYSRTHSAQSLAVYTECKGVSPSNWKGTSYIGGSTIVISIPARTSYAVTYDANGGEGTVADDTKWYDETLTLSDGTGLTRDHYTLKGWNTASDGTGTHYDLGAEYTGNEAVALYAEWELNAVLGDAKVSGEWKQGMLYAKVDGEWVIPHTGFVKVNNEWIEITT